MPISSYNNINISIENGNTVVFRRKENNNALSAIDLNNPAKLVISYTKLLFTPLLYHPNPLSVLNIGLGAGAFNRLFNIIYPDAKLVSVEIDSMVLNSAIKHTGLIETIKNQIFIADGREYISKIEDKWDWVILDAFTANSQIPSHLSTLEFFNLT